MEPVSTKRVCHTEEAGTLIVQFGGVESLVRWQEKKLGTWLVSVSQSARTEVPASSELPDGHRLHGGFKTGAPAL